MPLASACQAARIIQAVESEAEALQAARELIGLNAPAYPESLALAYEDGDGETTLIARGSDSSSIGIFQREGP